jgi:hypothetical protein
MGNVEGNVVQVSIFEVTLSPNGEFANAILSPFLVPEDNNRFEGGWLKDAESNWFPIHSNTTETVRVYAQDLSVPAEGDVWLYDDDAWQDGDDVRAPDMTALDDAMAEAYVEVRYDVGDSNDQATFVLNMEDEQDFFAALDWDSESQNSQAFWVAYVLGGFQFGTSYDNDPTEPDIKFGVTHNTKGGSVIFLETIRDWGVVNDPPGVAVVEQDTVVHEVGHAVADSSDEEGVTTAPTVPSRYSEKYLNLIRRNDKPRSP